MAWLEPHGAYRPAGRPDPGRRRPPDRRQAPRALRRRRGRLARIRPHGGGEDDVELFLVDREAEGVTLTQQFTIASDTQYRVDLDGAVGTKVDGATWEAGTG